MTDIEWILWQRNHPGKIIITIKSFETQSHEESEYHQTP